MKYEVVNNQIIFDKNDDFDAASILECGQLFRFFKTEKGYPRWYQSSEWSLQWVLPFSFCFDP